MSERRKQIRGKGRKRIRLMRQGSGRIHFPGVFFDISSAVRLLLGTGLPLCFCCPTVSIYALPFGMFRTARAACASTCPHRWGDCYRTSECWSVSEMRMWRRKQDSQHLPKFKNNSAFGPLHVVLWVVGGCWSVHCPVHVHST
jgi:hypothetical protein